MAQSIKGNKRVVNVRKSGGARRVGNRPNTANGRRSNSVKKTGNTRLEDVRKISNGRTTHTRGTSSVRNNVGVKRTAFVTKNSDIKKSGTIGKVRRVKRIKLKVRNALIFLILLVATIVCLSVLIRLNTFSYKLKEVGYSKKEITKIRTYDVPKTVKTVLTNSKYNKYLVFILEDSSFNVDRINLYLDIFSMYDGEYDSNILRIANDKYYKITNAERYLKYYLNNMDKDSRSIVEDVNCNLDKEYYKVDNSVDLSKGIFVLVNKYNRLNENYVPKDLVKIDKKYGYERMINRTAYSAFVNLYNDMSKEKLHITIISPYRSYDTQKSLYNNYVSTNGQAKADTFSARPGYSEHQTGLAMDIAASDHNYTKFVNTKEYQWMVENSYKYGFILRYPEGKESQTGYMFESWHYRYVGKEVAKYIYDNKITFDEYYEYFLR